LVGLLVFVELLWGAEFVDEIAPAPAAIGADVPLSYFGPTPSTVQKELIGPYQLLKSGVVDLDKGTITIPLYNGYMKKNNATNVWYVFTDTTDKENSEALGLNFSGKLRYANVGRGTRTATILPGNILQFANGLVDFSPVRNLVAGKAPNYFPPTTAEPGSIGDEFYSPLARITNSQGHIYNAPIVAGNFPAKAFKSSWCTSDITNAPDEAEARTMLHDKVVRFCPGKDRGDAGTVELTLTPGFSFARPVLYLSLDANEMLPAAMEGITFAPGLQDIEVGGDDSAFSAVERLFAVVNGYTNGDINNANIGGAPPNEKTHPSRQGFNSGLRGDGAFLNVLGGIPTVATDYSPLWDVNVGQWTPYAVRNGYRVRWLQEFQILGFAARGYITGPGGAPFGSSGFIVNCPIVYRFT
jgi:hypothetical protein